MKSISIGVSLRPGLEGLGGPYHDNDSDDIAVLQPLKTPPPYEAQWVGDTRFGYGAASVVVYQAGGTWYMLWAENMLATAPAASGVFTRLAEGDASPVRFDRKPMHWYPDYIRAGIPDAPYSEFYFENPIVARIPAQLQAGGKYIMVVGYYTDFSIGVTKQTCGFSTSQDGVRWSAVRPIRIGFGDCITVVSFIPEGHNTYAMYVTNRRTPVANNDYERLSKITVRLSLKK